MKLVQLSSVILSLILTFVISKTWVEMYQKQGFTLVTVLVLICCVFAASTTTIANANEMLKDDTTTLPTK